MSTVSNKKISLIKFKLIQPQIHNWIHCHVSHNDTFLATQLQLCTQEQTNNKSCEKSWNVRHLKLKNWEENRKNSKTREKIKCNRTLVKFRLFFNISKYQVCAKKNGKLLFYSNFSQLLFKSIPGGILKETFFKILCNFSLSLF